MDYTNTQMCSFVVPEGSRSDFAELCEKQVKQWEVLHHHGISNKTGLWALVKRRERNGLSARFLGLSA